MKGTGREKLHYVQCNITSQNGFTTLGVLIYRFLVTDYHLQVVGMLEAEQMRHKLQSCLNYSKMIAPHTVKAQN
jgi:hypothetical protein